MFEQLCYDIFEYFNSNISSNSIQTVKLKQIAAKTTFPKINKKNLRNLLTKSTENSNICTLLHDVNFVFSLNFKDLETITTLIIPMNQIEREYILNYVLYSFLAWCVEFDTNKTLKDIDILLHSLNSAYKLQNIEFIEKAFVCTLNMAIESQKFLLNIHTINEICSFFENLPKLDPIYLYIFPSLTKILFTSQYLDSQRFNELLINMISLKGIVFPKSMLETMLFYLKKPICELTTISWKLYQSLSFSMNETYITELYKDICQSLLRTIHQNEHFKLQKRNNPQIISRNYASSFDFNNAGSDIRYLDIKDSKIIIAGIPSESILNPALILQRDIVLCMLMQTNGYISIFIQVYYELFNFIPLDNENYFPTYMLFIDIITGLQKSGYKVDNYHIDLTKSFLFEDDYFIDENFEIRKKIYSPIFSNNTLFLKILKEFLNYPMKFQELCQLVAINFENAQMKLINAPTTYKTFISGYACLLHATYQNNYELDILFQKYFKSLEIILQNSKVSTTLFNDENFCTAIICFSIQNKVRNFIFEQFEIFLSSNKITTAFLNSMLNLIHLSKFQMNNVECVKYFIGFIDVLLKISSFNHSTILEISRCFFDLVLGIEKNELNRILIMKVIKLTSSLGFDLDLTNDEINKLDIIVRELDFDQELTDSLFDILSPTHKAIVYPQVASSLFYTHNDFDHNLKNAEILEKIVNYSNQNAEKLHNAQFDIELIDHLTDILHDENVSKEYFTVMINLFRSIAKTKSSPVVVHKFLKLLTPDENEKYSSHLYSVINCLIDLSEYQAQYYVLNRKNLKKRYSMPNGFTLIYTCANPVFKKNTSFVLVQKDKNFIQIYPNDNSVIFASNIEKNLVTVSLNYLSLNHFSITFIPGKNDTLVKFNLNGALSEYVSKFKWDNTVEVVLNHELICSANQVNYALLNPLPDERIFKYLVNDSSLFFLEKQDLVFSNRHDTNTENFTNNFISCLIMKFKPEIILPLFANPIIKFDNGEEKTFIFDFINLLNKILYISEQTEQQFAVSEATELMMSLLKQMRNEFIIYDLYIRFNILYNSISISSLKNKLLTNIMMNIEIWSKSSDAEKIFNHWLNAFIDENMKLIDTNINLLDIFSSALSIYEANKLMRSIFYKIIVKISPNLMNFNILTSIVNSVKTFKDKEISLEILEMIKDITLVPSSPIHNMNHTDNSFISIFFNLVDNASGIICAAIFDIILNIKVYKSSINTILFAMLSNANESVYCIELFDKMLEFLFSVDRVLPVICYVAFKIGSNAVSKLVDYLVSKPFSSKIEYWPVFMIGLFKLMNLATFQKLLNYLIKSISDWKYIYRCVEIVASTFNNSNLFVTLIDVMIEYIEENKISQNQFDQFIFIVIYFVFFREEDGNNALMCLMQAELNEIVNDKSALDSYFYIHPPSKFPTRLGVDDYFGLLSNPGQQRTKFGVRCDSYCEWIDADLCSRAGAVIYQSELTDRNLSCLLLIVYMMIGINNDFVSVVLSDIKLPHKLSSFSKSLMNLITIKNRVMMSEDMKFSTSSIIKTIRNDEMMLIYEQSISDFEAFVVEYLQIDMKSDEIAKQIIESYNVIKQKYIDLKVVSFNAKIVTDIIETYKNNQNEISEFYRNLWNKKWQDMKNDVASPWNNVKEYHYKRDDTLCFTHIPFKMKRNYNFYDHVNSKKVQEEQKPIQDFKNVAFDALLKTKCQLIKMDKEIDCVLEMREKIFYITKTNKMKPHVIKYSEIDNVFVQTYLHKRNSLEIYLKRRKSLFIKFNSVDTVNSVLKVMNTCEVKTSAFNQFSEYLSEKILQWLNKEISNFEYLIFLNYASGRTFMTPFQYPIMPWVLIDYSSDTLDLNDPKIYRDFSKPVGAQNETKLNQIKEIHNDNNLNYLYESALICPLMLYDYMIRVEPFTSLHVDMQSGRFDEPERIFTSMERMCQQMLHDMNVFSELIPEFYYFPEMFINENHFDFGFANNKKINDVLLPPWSHNNPIEFVYKMRKALESDYVSAHLNEWIDLVFGVKQRGQNAIDNDNVFKPDLYEEIWNKQLSDIEEKSVEAAKKLLGQIPHQLFNDPHPKRQNDAADEICGEEDQSYSLAHSGYFKKEIVRHSSNNIFAPTPHISNRLSHKRKFSDISILSDNKVSLLDENRNKSGMQKMNIYITDMVYASCFETNYGNFTMITVRNNAVNNKGLLVTKINIENFKIENTVLNFNFVQVNADRVVSSVTYNSLIVMSKNIDYHYKLKTNEMNYFSNGMMVFAQDRKYFCFIDNSYTLYLYFIEDFSSHVFRAPYYLNVPQCIAISVLFSTIVVCSNKGFVSLHSFDDGSVIRAFNIGECKPIRVQISPSWGFIVIQSTKVHEGKIVNVISIYTINGLFVTEKVIPHNITLMTTFRNPSGFDYIAYATEDGAVYVCEIFYMQTKNTLIRMKEKIIQLSYARKSNALIIITNDGKVICKFIDFDKL